MSKVLRKSSYDYDELLKAGTDGLFGIEYAQLPAPPLLMVDRLKSVTYNEKTNQGSIIAEQDINPDLWFFDCHFHNDPVMPGCLGLDAMWQLVGFWLAWHGLAGKGRALGVEEVKFSGQVTKKVKLLRYEVTIKRIMQAHLIIGIADGITFADDKPIYHAKNMKVGLMNPERLEILENS